MYVCDCVCGEDLLLLPPVSLFTFHSPIILILQTSSQRCDLPVVSKFDGSSLFDVRWNSTASNSLVVVGTAGIQRIDAETGKEMVR